MVSAVKYGEVSQWRGNKFVVEKSKQQPMDWSDRRQPSAQYEYYGLSGFSRETEPIGDI